MHRRQQHCNVKMRMMECFAVPVHLAVGYTAETVSTVSMSVVALSERLVYQCVRWLHLLLPVQYHWVDQCGCFIGG
eukprot:SAG11_NODE_536_length_8674_cov_6.314985_4_plen_76_part_00